MSVLVGGVKLDCRLLHTDIDCMNSVPEPPAFRETTMQTRQPISPRRTFSPGAATVGAAAAAVVALPHVVPSDAVVSEPARVAPEKGGGYHLSAHVKQYYKTTQL